MIEPKLLRRTIRLLRAIQLLHKHGYEQLGCTFTAGENIESWTLAICHVNNLLVDNKHCVVTMINERENVYIHQLGTEGNDYFGWKDVKSASVDELALIILKRCSSLVSSCRGENVTNVGWLTQLMGFVELHGQLPYASINKLHIEPSWTFPLGKPHLVTLPPGTKLYSSKEADYRYEKVDVDQGCDWHVAHLNIVTNITSQSVWVLPEYPAKTLDVTEMGAYWEGAVYFVFKHLRITSLQDFLLFLEDKPEKYPMGIWFYRIYDSSSQLDFFVAFVVRELLQKSKDNNLSNLQIRWQKWLKYFENKHRPNKGEPHYYNPYYGGNNPLHLGMIFQNEKVNWLKN